MVPEHELLPLLLITCSELPNKPAFDVHVQEITIVIKTSVSD